MKQASGTISALTDSEQRKCSDDIVFFFFVRHVAVPRRQILKISCSKDASDVENWLFFKIRIELMKTKLPDVVSSIAFRNGTLEGNLALVPMGAETHDASASLEMMGSTRTRLNFVLSA